MNCFAGFQRCDLQSLLEMLNNNTNCCTVFFSTFILTAKINKWFQQQIDERRTLMSRNISLVQWVERRRCFFSQATVRILTRCCCVQLQYFRQERLDSTGEKPSWSWWCEFRWRRGILQLPTHRYSRSLHMYKRWINILCNMKKKRQRNILKEKKTKLYNFYISRSLCCACASCLVKICIFFMRKRWSYELMFIHRIS